MSHVASEIASQPDCWRQAAQVAATRPAGLPERGERVAVLGCGTSLYIAQAYATLREAAGAGETDAFTPTEAPLHRPYDRVVAITRSGTTTEILDALRGLRAGLPSVAITADPTTPVVQAAHDVVVLDFADEQSVVQTRFATSCLALLRASLGEDVESLALQAKEAIDEPLPAGVLERSQFTFVGTGFAVGIAAEAALKMREASNSWTESYPATEYRHGPFSITDERSVTWAFGTVSPALLEDVRATGAIAVHHDRDPMADLIVAQRLAVALAEARGLDPDRPRNLTRSVILTDGA
ncbi:MAG: SIS domain-containing protein [Mycobacteriales bacterium]